MRREKITVLNDEEMIEKGFTPLTLSEKVALCKDHKQKEKEELHKLKKRRRNVFSKGPDIATEQQVEKFGGRREAAIMMQKIHEGDLRQLDILINNKELSIEGYQLRLDEYDEKRDSEVCNAERRKYHSDNYWDTVFEKYYSSQNMTWPMVHEIIAKRMDELGLEVKYSSFDSFDSRRKQVQKDR